MDKINIQEILDKHRCSNMPVHSAIKEIVEKALELAAENAYVINTKHSDNSTSHIVHKESITNTINQIEF